MSMSSARSDRRWASWPAISARRAIGCASHATPINSSTASVLFRRCRLEPILPGGALGNVTETSSLGWSHYKGLWLSANERPFKGLQFNASYTLAKSTDTNSLSTAIIYVQDSNNIADSEGPSVSTSGTGS